MECRLTPSNQLAAADQSFWYGPKHFDASGKTAEKFYERIWFPPYLSRAKPWHFWIGVGPGGRVRDLAVDGELHEMKPDARVRNSRITWFRSIPVSITVSIYNGEQAVGIRGGMFSFKATGPLRACFVTNDENALPPSSGTAFETERFGITRDQLGSSRLTPDAVEVGSSHVFKLRYTAGPAGIATGGGLLVAAKWGLFPRPVWPELDTANDPSYLKILSQAPLTVRTGARIKYRIAEVDFGTIGFETRDHLVRLELQEGQLKKGDVVTFELGSSEKPVQVNQVFPYTYREVVQQRWYTPTVPFKVLVDPSGKGVFLPLAEKHHHALSIRARKAARWHVWTPSMAEPGAKITARAHALDEFNNRPANTLKGKLKIGLGGAEKLAPVRSNHLTAPFRLPKTGASPRVELRAPKGRTLGLGNPIRVGKEYEEGRIYWGEIHAHCEMCDGLGKVEDYFSHARDVAGLDFTSLTDHAEYLTDAQWRQIQDRSNAWYRPNQFVTLVGYEWGDTHRCIYTVKSTQPMYRSNWVETIDLNGLRKVLKGRTDCIVVPHHTLYTPYSTQGEPPVMEPLIEMYSMWGNSEYPGAPYQDKDPTPDDVISLLKRGYRFGFTCGSDNHDGRPGLSGRGARVKSRYGNLTFQAGLTAVYCKELTRESVFEALRNRRCYGTTGARILLHARVNGAGMGSVIPRPRTGGVRVEVEVAGTSPIARIEIVKNGENVRTEPGHSDRMTFSWVDPVGPSRDAADFYYVRVTQTDGEIAWASPVWVE